MTRSDTGNTPTHADDGRRVAVGGAAAASVARAARWGLLAVFGSVVSLVVTVGLEGWRLGAVPTHQLPSLVAVVLLGTWLLQASIAWRRAGRRAHEGHLLDGLRKLRVYLIAMGTLIIVSLALGVVAVVGLLYVLITQYWLA